MTLAARQRAVAILGLSAFLAQPATAAEWWFAAAAPQAVAFVDLASLERAGEVATVSLEYRVRAPDNGVEYTRIKIAYDCGNAASIVLAEQGFAGDTPVTVETHGSAAEANQPGTMGGAVQEFVCGAAEDRAGEGDRLTLPTARVATRFFKLAAVGIEPPTAMILAGYQAVPPREALEQWIAPELRTTVAAILADD